MAEEWKKTVAISSVVVCAIIAILVAAPVLTIMATQDMVFKYSAVKFLNTNGVAAVPISWVSEHEDGTSYCVWPPKNNTLSRTAILKLVPEDDWQTYEVDILGKYDTYDEAFKKELKEAKSSESEGERGRGKRRVKRKILDSDTDEDGPSILAKCFKRNNSQSKSQPNSQSASKPSNKESYPKYYKIDKNNVSENLYNKLIEKFIDPDAPLSARVRNDDEAMQFLLSAEEPNFNKNIAVTEVEKTQSTLPSQEGPTTNILATKVTDISNITQPVPGDNTLQADITANESNEESTTLTDNDVSSLSDTSTLTEVQHNTIFQHLRELKATVNIILQKLNTESPVMEILIPNSASSKLPVLPCTSIDGLIELESLLESDETAIKQLETKLLLIGGQNYKQYIYRCLKSLFTNNLAANCSLKGKKNNFALEGLKILDILYQTILKSYTITKLQFDSAVMEWFKHGRQRSMKDANK